MTNLDDQLAEEYLSGCREHLDSMETDLLAIENGGAEIDRALVSRVWRAIHAVREDAIRFDLAKVGELARGMEDALALIVSRGTVPAVERISALLRAADRLRDLIRDPGGAHAADITGLMSALAGSTLRVLLVEDDFASRLLMQTFLSRYGECHLAVNGREAVEAFRSAAERGQRYDLICMDIMMPEMDGLEAVRRVRAMEEADGIPSTSGAKIIMTTAVDDIQEVGRCYNELCDAYLVKPIDLAKLLARMQSWKLTP